MLPPYEPVRRRLGLPAQSRFGNLGTRAPEPVVRPKAVIHSLACQTDRNDRSNTHSLATCGAQDDVVTLAAECTKNISKCDALHILLVW
jgi:hypothetical protein